MNKKLLITDIIFSLFSLVLLCCVQLIILYNPLLLSSKIILVSITIFLFVAGAYIMIFSYKNNTENISLGNCLLHLVLGVLLYGFYSIPALGFADYNGIGNSICIAIVGLFSSRFAFSFSKYAEKHTITGKVKMSNNINLKMFYSRNISCELFEIMKTVGVIFLVIGIFGIVYNIFDPCFNIALPIKTR